MSLHSFIDNRIDKIVGVFTISILFGKFVGDFAAYVLIEQFGSVAGYTIGVVVTTLLLIFWPKLEPDDPGVNQ